MHINGCKLPHMVALSIQGGEACNKYSTAQAYNLEYSEEDMCDCVLAAPKETTDAMQCYAQESEKMWISNARRVCQAKIDNSKILPQICDLKLTFCSFL